MKPLQRFVKIKKETVCTKYSYCIYFFVKNLYYKHVINLHLFFITFFFRTWKSYSHLKNNGFFFQLVCLSVSPRCGHSLQRTDPAERDLWCQKVRGGRQCSFSRCPHWGHLHDKRAPDGRLHVWGTTQRYEKHQHWKENISFFFYEQYNTTSKRLN